MECFAAQERLSRLRQQAGQCWQQIDALVLPTTPTIYRLNEIAADPVGRNSDLGRTNNFANLLDTAAVAVPAYPGRDGMPTGVTLFAPAGQDQQLLHCAQTLQQHNGCGIASASERAETITTTADIELLALGAHLRGQPLHHRLLDLGAQFSAEVRTAANYRLLPAWCHCQASFASSR